MLSCSSLLSAYNFDFLLTPTHKSLNKLIYICEQYAIEFDIKFNDAKSKHVVHKGKNYIAHHKDVFL